MSKHMTVRALIAKLSALNPDLEVRVVEDNQMGDNDSAITGVQEWDNMAVIEIADCIVTAE